MSTDVEGICHPPSPLRLSEIKADRVLRRQAPSSASVESLQAELDSCLTSNEKEYVDSVVRQKAAEFSREVAIKRRLRTATKASLLGQLPLNATGPVPHTPSTPFLATLRRATSASALPRSKLTPPSSDVRRPLNPSKRRDDSILASSSNTSSPGQFSLVGLAGGVNDAALPSADVPPHHTGLQLEHMLTREMHAQKHRHAMEHFAIKLEAEAAAW
ncbi:hypothetical protein, variant [Aphanomyces invadans]|uniref:Uncharacterized protein n=1 Tax=Aphanomyces invadans TaxID=157072 RepID=A0A024U4Z4_9STRA|nr:hypothetical protein H310_06885 [Aphanomyces invadans]XP_008870322.1 hypothetical protein, variant [Aphanomyces invadans]ETW01323.1 hypothetical protein H310_06885 [Aphanomyces invadans]ETW01324.1 hypothetical protein, variant [Aphanomyces invadans]|eukprot:XP_008870321.1 hypothetical protein H310_06885 [Aphanomyces invadans]